MSQPQEKGLLSVLGDSLASLRLTIGLLIILAVASIFGTVIPQNASPEEYFRVYAMPTYRILKILGFLDMYHAWWFFLLLGLLGLNLIVCSLKRFRITLRVLSAGANLEGSPWKATPLNMKFTQKSPPAQLLPQFQEILARSLSRPRILEASPPYHLFAEKGKLSRFGVYFIHLSVLVILGGALIGYYFGFRGNLNIVEGEAAHTVILRSEGRAQPLGFSVRLDKFNVSFYPTGAPKEFKSTVTIFAEGRQLLTESIRVNHPLTYQGISFYQSSYGIASVEKAVLSVKDRETRKEMRIPAQMGIKTEIPGSVHSFLLARFIQDLQGMGPALQMVLFQPNRPHENFWVLQNHPEFAERQPGRYAFIIRELEPKYYSGLQVTRDPGVWVVWIGCFLMLGGFYMTFFLSHRRIWVRLSAKGEGTLVEIGGASHRDRAGLAKELESIQRALRNSPSKEPKKLEKTEDQP